MTVTKRTRVFDSPSYQTRSLTQWSVISHCLNQLIKPWKKPLHSSQVLLYCQWRPIVPEKWCWRYVSTWGRDMLDQNHPRRNLAFVFDAMGSLRHSRRVSARNDLKIIILLHWELETPDSHHPQGARKVTVRTGHMIIRGHTVRFWRLNEGIASAVTFNAQ